MTLSPKPKPGYMRPMDAAEYLSVHQRTIYRLILSKTLKSHKVDGAMVIKVSDIDALHLPMGEVGMEPSDVLLMKTPSNKPPSVKPTYMRAPEAARYICVSVSTIYRMIVTKELKSYRVGGSRIFKVADLDALVEAGGGKQEGG